MQNAPVDEHPLAIADEGDSSLLDVGQSSIKDGDGSGQAAMERARSPLNNGRELTVLAFHVEVGPVCCLLAWVRTKAGPVVRMSLWHR